MKKKLALFFTIAFLLATEASAKEARDAETVTVTAQKIEQKLQDVPMSITVFDEFNIEDQQIESLEDIARYTPNLLLFNANTSGVLLPTIRGINTGYGSFASSMGLFVDGVPILGPSGLDTPIADVKRIEVLKGPQGTLYGRGAEGGVINVITKKPDNKIRGKLGVELGSDNKRQYTLNASGPLLKDKIYLGASGKHYEKDGFVYNSHLNKRADDIENDYWKIFLRFTPLDNLDISLISSKLKNDNSGTPTGLKDQNERIKEVNEEYVRTETILHALKIDYNISGIKIESITTKREIKDIWNLDYDYTPVKTKFSNNDSTKENISQELRVSYSSNKLDWLAGVNFSKDDFDIKYITHYGTSKSYFDNEAYGFFTHLQYHLTERFSVLGGIRYDNNENEYEDPYQKLDLSFTEVSPKFGFEYQVLENSMVYTTVAKGYREAGFYPYAAPGDPTEYEQETLWSYEIGSKNLFLNKRLLFNVAAYYMKLDDMQVDISSGDSSYKTNAAEVTSKGVELDLNFKATDDLTLFVAYGYNNTTFDEYKDAKGDYSENDNPYAPRYNYNLGVQYRNEKGYFGRIDVNGYGKMYLDRDNKNSVDAYTLLNTKFGYEQERFDIYFYAQNMFDKNYDYVGDMNGNYRTYSPPRETGIRINYRF